MEKTFFFLYSGLSFLLYLLALPFLILFSVKAKYKEALPSRFFLWRNTPLRSDGIWFHACSLGEAKALKPLVDAFPQEVLRMSATTQTGFGVMRTYAKESRYLPFEPLLFCWLRPQKALVVMEAEFWYLLFVLAHKRGTKTLLINARMSDRSYPKYRQFRWFYAQLFKHIDEVYAQTETDKQRLLALGAKDVKVTGNIKLAYLPRITTQIQKPSGLVVCGASTHEGEEELILKAFVALKKVQHEAVLLLVPRHPERFEAVAKMLADVAAQTGYTVQRYTQNVALSSDIVLVDVMGQSVNLYAISDIVILGGAFVPTGGHNAAEAAQFGCKIISGKHYFNQKDIFEAIEGIAVVEAEELVQCVLDFKKLEHTKIRYKSDLTPILESIQCVL